MRNTIQLGHELQKHNMTKNSKLSEELLQKIRCRRKCLYKYNDMSYRGALKWVLKMEAVPRTCYAKRTGYRVEQPELWVFPLTRLCNGPNYHYVLKKEREADDKNGNLSEKQMNSRSIDKYISYKHFSKISCA